MILPRGRGGRTRRGRARRIYAALDLPICSFRGTFQFTPCQTAARGPDAAQDTSHDAARHT